MERKYTVKEIDRMRRAVWRWRRYPKAETEDELRTYLLNGTDPEELEALADEKEIERQRKRKGLWVENESGVMSVEEMSKKENN